MYFTECRKDLPQEAIGLDGMGVQTSFSKET